MAPSRSGQRNASCNHILRQGNENAEVAVYRYVTEGSVDAYMWQALETKAKFIGQVMSGENALRLADDIGGQELSYAEVKATARIRRTQLTPTTDRSIVSDFSPAGQPVQQWAERPEIMYAEQSRGRDDVPAVLRLYSRCPPTLTLSRAGLIRSSDDPPVEAFMAHRTFRCFIEQIADWHAHLVTVHPAESKNGAAVPCRWATSV